VDHAAREVDVIPDEPQQFGDPHAAVDRRREQGPVARQGGAQEPPDLVASQDALAPANGMWPLVGLEPTHRIVDDPAVAEREAHDAVQRRERSGARLLRAALGTQGGEELCHILDMDGPHQTSTEDREEMLVEVVAVRL
jgi:hypothetical protein